MIVIVWQLLSMAGVIDERTLASPLQIAQRAVELIQDGTLGSAEPIERDPRDSPRPLAGHRREVRRAAHGNLVRLVARTLRCEDGAP